MSKAEILSALNTSGEVSIFRRSANWEKAFQKYKEEKGHSKSLSCGSCYREVLQWLRN